MNNNHVTSTEPRKRLLRRLIPESLRENHVSRVVLWIVIVSGLVLMLLGFFIHAVVSDIVEIRSAEFTEGQDRIARRYERLLEDLRATEEERSLLGGVRSPKGNLVPFVQSLELTAQRANVTQTLEAITGDKDPNGQPYSSPVIRYTLTLEGPLDAVIAYLGAVHDVPQLVRVETLDITSPADENILASAVAIARIAVAVREENGE